MNKSNKKYVIAVDGFSSCGKSTVAKSLAKTLNFLYIDSGAMYRAVTLYCLRNNFIVNEVIDETRLKQEIKHINIDLRKDDVTNRYTTFLNGENVENEIRNIQVSGYVSPVSKIGFVREKMVKLQRSYARKTSVVMDGRDIGTVVFPDADVKIFMTAEPKIRAERRYKELQAKGQHVKLEEIQKNIEERDRIDQSRAISPLKKAEDAIVLDNSYMNHDEQLQWAMEQVLAIINN